MLSRSSRAVVLSGLASSALCVAYFQVVDRFALSSAGFAAIFRYLLIEVDAKTAWLALGICTLAAAWRNLKPIVVIVDGFSRHPRGVAVLAASALSAGARFAYDNCAFSMDEYAATFQAQLFAGGHLFAHLPPNAVDWLIVRGFNGAFIYASRESGQALAAYWPGFAMLLAPFQFLGIPWICNALLSGGTLYLVFLITLEISGNRRAAGWAMLFTLSSGAFVAYGMSYYSMQAHLTVNLGFAYLLLRPTRRRAVAAGLLGSLALNLHNPFPHVLFAAPWLLSMAADKRQRHCLGLLVMGYLPGLLVGVTWLWLRSGLVSADGVAAVSGVGAGVFTWPDAALLNIRVASLVKLWLWACPGLTIFALFAIHRCFANRAVRLLAYSAGLTFLGYLFVRFDQGHGWGYRYFHSAWGVLPILAGIAMVRGDDTTSSRLPIFAGAAALLSLAVIVPFQIWQIKAVITRNLAQLPAPQTPGRNVFFIRPLGGFYLADRVQIDPFLQSRALMLATRGAPLDAELRRQNWPHARRIASGPWGEQWVIGVSTANPISRDGLLEADLPFDRLRFDPNAGAR